MNMRIIIESMYNIYKYRMQMTLEISFSFFTCDMICCLWRKFIKGIIFFITFIPLKSYLEGFHMKIIYIGRYFFLNF
ncbi:MAG: accessory gene regulator B family protein [Aminipila sp.]